jgi:hypothetical protein
MKIYHPPLTPPIKGGEVLARAGNEGVGTNPSNQEGEWGCYSIKGESPLSYCGRGLGKLLLQQVNHYCLVPSPLVGEGWCEGYFQVKALKIVILPPDRYDNA